MPRIPTYGSPQQRLRALPGARQESIVSPGLLDAPAEQTMRVGQQLQSAGAEFNKIAVQMQDRENADMLFRAESAIKTDYITYENAVRNRRGQDAWGSTEDTAKWWDENVKKHSENLGNDTQRKLFDQSTTRMRLQSIDSVSKHEAEQRRLSLDASAQASIVSSINMAAADAANAGKLSPMSQPEPTDVEVTEDEDGNETVSVKGGVVVRGGAGFNVSAYKQDILKRTAVLAQINGWSPELKEAKEAEYLTNFHKQIINARADKDPSGAKAYFEANRSEINGTDHAMIEKTLKTAGLKETAQSFADEVQTSGLGEADALASARKEFSGEEEAAVVLEIKTRFREKDQLREGEQRKAGDQAWDTYAKTKNLRAVPADVLNRMDGKDRLALEKEAQAFAAGVTVKTDPNVYYDLRKMIRDNPAEFQKLNLREYFPMLSANDREEFIKLQTNPVEMAESATLTQQLSNMHDQMGWGSRDKEKKGLFDNVVTKTINEEQKRLGKKLTQEERQKIIDRMVMQGEVLSGSWYSRDPDRLRFQVLGTEEGERFVADADRKTYDGIPKKDREEIEAALTKRGKKATPANVLRLYKDTNGIK